MTARGSDGRRRYRIVSYNVHACIGRDRVFSPGRIRDVLAPLHADFIALQEVEDNVHAGIPVSDYLADRLGMHLYRGATHQRTAADYGNLLLARLEAEASTRHNLSVAGREPRGMIEADFRLGDDLLRFFVTHLGLAGGERRRQRQRLLDELERRPADIRVLAGDFNEWRPYSALHRQLRRRFGPGPMPRTFPSQAPLLALDRVFVSPNRLVDDVRVVRNALTRVASDHLPLVVDITL